MKARPMQLQDHEATVVLFSGGADSALVLAREMMAPKTSSLYAMYVRLLNNKQKVKAEMACATACYQQLRDRYADGFRCSFLTPVSDVVTVGGPGGGLIQPAVWVSQAALFMGLAGLTGRVLTGWIGSDQAPSRIDALDRALKSLWASITGLPDEMGPRLEAPLVEMDKDEVNEHIRALPVDVRKYAWTCENPKHVVAASGVGRVPCGTCNTCLTARRHGTMPNQDEQPGFNQIDGAWGNIAPLGKG